MQIRTWSLVIGVVYLVLGILGFIPALQTRPPASAPHVDVTAAYGYLFSQFAVNAVHNVINIVIGLLGILAYVRVGSARAYSRFCFLFFGIATFIGFVPTLDTLGGIAPIFGADIIPHAVTSVLSGYFGWVADEETNAAPALASAH